MPYFLIRFRIKLNDHFKMIFIYGMLQNQTLKVETRRHGVFVLIHFSIKM